jgi:glycosyltransferase involved in cell wall biosynthesis
VPTEIARQACLAQGIEPERVVLILPAIERPQQTPVTRKRLNKALSLPAESRLVAVGGPLVRRRAVDEAIWAFELLRTVNPAARLLVLGDGPERLRLERFSRLAADASAIRFINQAEDAAKVLPLAEVFWHTGSELPGATSLAVLEAIAVGVPVVATDLPCHREWIESGASGFLAPVGGRALFARHSLRLLDDVRLGQQMAALAWGAARSLVAERVVREYTALY